MEAECFYANPKVSHKYSIIYLSNKINAKQKNIILLASQNTHVMK